MNICNESDCFGCGACQNICPQNAIVMSYDKEGFLLPQIKDNCINCLKCKKVCPALIVDDKGNKPIKAFKGFSDDLSVRIDSTSGGVFSELARRIINANGSVYGACLDGSLNVKHMRVENFADLRRLRGSKYVGSDTSDVYKSIKKDLLDGKLVLFSGTPCQVAGLYSYIGKDRSDNLFMCDFICHGVGSMRIFQEQIKYLENKMDSKSSEIYFRSKVKGYKNSSFYVTFDNGGKYISKSYRNEFGYAFSRGMINRLSCSTCRFATEYRLSDVTLSDCLLNLNKDEQKNGCSFVMINTPKGETLIRGCNVTLNEVPLEQIVRVQSHLSRPQAAHVGRESIMKNIDVPFAEKRKTYLKVPGRNIVNSLLSRVKNAIKQIHKR